MSVRAVWHTPELAVVEEDIFDVTAVGVPIVLAAAGEEATLNEALMRSVAIEAELDEQGVRCRVKDSPESSCYACPLYRADGSPLAQLCAVGREQERASTLLLARRYGG